MNPLALAPSTVPNAEPMEYLLASEEAGFDMVGLRLYPSPILPYFPIVGNQPLIRDIKRFLANSNLTMLDIFTFYLRPGVDVANFRPAFDLGVELGAKYALVLGDDPDWSRMRDNFAAMCDLAKPLGLTCSLEFAVMRALSSLPATLQMLDEVHKDNTMICIDPINFVRSGAVPDDLRRIDPKLLPYTQLNDGFLGPGEPDLSKLGKMGPNKRCLIGEGALALNDILDALPAGIPLSIEVPIEEVPSAAQTSSTEWIKKIAKGARKFLGDRESRAVVR